MANVINKLQKPTLILAHNKTLAAQLYGELKELVPTQPRGILHQLLRLLPARILPASPRHVHRKRLRSVNDEIEKMRMHAVSSIVSRNDTIIVASISCIYSLGNPDDFRTMAAELEVGKQISRQRTHSPTRRHAV